MDRDAKKNAVRSKHVIDACPKDDATDEAVVASYEPAKLGAASVLPLAPISNLSLAPRFLRTNSIYIN